MLREHYVKVFPNEERINYREFKERTLSLSKPAEVLAQRVLAREASRVELSSPVLLNLHRLLNWGVEQHYLLYKQTIITVLTKLHNKVVLP